MIVNLSEALKQLGFKTPYTVRKAVKDGYLDDYLRVGPDRRCTYLELTPPGMPTLRERIQHHTAFHGNSPLWDRDEPGLTMSDEALEDAMSPINKWIESREDWTARAAEFIDPSCWKPPPWTADQWRSLKVIIELATNEE